MLMLNLVAIQNWYGVHGAWSTCDASGAMVSKVLLMAVAYDAEGAILLKTFPMLRMFYINVITI